MMNPIEYLKRKMAEKKSLLSFEEVSFFVKVLFVFGCWKLLHTWLWRTPESKYDWHLHLAGFESAYATLTSHILVILGFTSSIATGNHIFITQTSDLWVAEHCLAIPAMVVFTFSMLLFQGKASEKLWFIPLGVLGIFLINLIRLVSLALLMVHVSEGVYQLYHRYIFKGLTYGVILLMVIWWMDRVMRQPAPDTKTTEI